MRRRVGPLDVAQVSGGASHLCRTQVLGNVIHGSRPVDDPSICDAQAERGQGILRFAAVAEHARASLSRKPDSMVPLQIADM
jgi:hypothetical protein